MKVQFIKIALLVAALSFQIKVAAEDITDTVTDVEEITADSEAAKAQARAARAEVDRERAENAKALRAAYKAKADAENKRQQAAMTIQSSEAELQRLGLEQRNTQKELDKLQFNILAAERIIQKSKEKIDKRKQENAALEAIKKEKEAKLAALNKEQMQLVRDASAVEDQNALLQRDLEKVIADEIATTKALERTKSDAAMKRIELEKRISGLKERYRQIRDQRQAADLEARKAKQTNYRLEQTVKAGQAEIQNSTETPKEVPQPSAEDRQEPQAEVETGAKESLVSGR